MKRIHAYPDRRRDARSLIDLVARARLAGLGVALWLPASSSTVASEAEWDTHAVAGEILASVEEVCTVLRDLESFPRWFPGIEEWRLLDPTRSDPAADAVPVYGRQLGPGPVSDRDYVVHYRLTSSSGGGCALEANAISDADPLPTASVVRIESMRTRWTAVASEKGSRVSYTIEIAPGPIPERVRPERFKTAPRKLIERLGEEIAARRSQPGDAIRPGP